MTLNFIDHKFVDVCFLSWEAVMFGEKMIGHIARNNAVDSEFYFCAYKEIDFGRVAYDMDFSGRFKTLADARKQAKKFADWKFAVV
jgi:hypothetical protein